MAEPKIVTGDGYVAKVLMSKDACLITVQDRSFPAIKLVEFDRANAEALRDALTRALEDG